MPNNQFFSISKDDLSYIVDNKDLTLNNKIRTLAELGRKFHKNIFSGNFETNQEAKLCREVLERSDIEWKNLRLDKLYRRYAEDVYGKNEIIEGKKKSFMSIFIGNMNDKTLILLFFAALLSLAIGIYKIIEDHDTYAWMEGGSIMLAVVIILLLSSINEYSQENLFTKLDKKSKNFRVKIFKNNVMDTLKSNELIVGDIIYLEPGDLVPADCGIITEDYVITDESMISGESENINKSLNTDPILISGTYVIEGSAKAIVLRVGTESTKGKIIQDMNLKEKKTPLEIKVEELANYLAKKAFLVAMILLVSHLLKLTYYGNGYKIRKILELIIESISIVVMAVPEGLPMAITLALSFATKRMLKDNNLVRDISACETMNNVNYICTDKTGTLTHNIMTVRQVFVNDEICQLNDPNGADLFAHIKGNVIYDLTMKNMIINSSSFENSEGIYIGSKSESAILKIMKDHKIDYNFIRREFEVIRRQPFSSTHKYMSSMIKYKNKYFVFFKGAPEKIAELCTSELKQENKTFFNGTGLHKFIKNSDKKCYRTIAYSYAVINHFDPEAINLGKYECTFLCAIAMEDPLRPNVQEEIKKCTLAGINVIMLTGDKMAMAENVATKIGILTPQFISTTGNQIRHMSDFALEEIIHKIRLVARASPHDKKRFVEILQKSNNTVAVTGDGTNDGPALKTANVGFGMGLSGTDIAKEASSIIIMDDNFSSIVKSIMWGRCINRSVRKFIQFQLTTTITTIVIAIISSLSSRSGYSAFSPLKLLWINIIMDTFAALALSTDKPNHDLLRRKPEPKNVPIITSRMKWFIFSASFFQFFIISLLYYFKYSHTYIFNTFIFMQIFNEVNARSLDPFESPFTGLIYNKPFIITNLLVIILQFFIINNLQIIFKTKRLTLEEWFFSILTAWTIIVFFIMLRIIGRMKAERNMLNCKTAFKHFCAEMQLLYAFKDFGNTAYEL